MFGENHVRGIHPGTRRGVTDVVAAAASRCGSARLAVLLAITLGPLIKLEPAAAQQLQGFTEPHEVVLVASPEAGILRSMSVVDGDHVQRNQILCTLDAEVLHASLEAAKAKAEATGAMDAAAATVALRQTRFDNMSSLQRQGHASPEEVTRALADLSIAKANLASALEDARQRRLEIKQIEAQIERRTIRSPLDGVVLQVHKREGEFVAGNEPQIATIAQLSLLRLRFHLPTETALLLTADQELQVWFPQLSQSAVGRISFISPVTDSDSGTVRVEAVIDNRDEIYRSGLHCELVNLPTASPTTTSPTTTSPATTVPATTGREVSRAGLPD